jgi:hypothetical protein
MLHAFLTSPLDKDLWSALRSSRFVYRERLSVHVVWEAGGLQSLSWRAEQEKNTSYARIRTATELRDHFWLQNIPKLTD